MKTVRTAAPHRTLALAERLLKRRQYAQAATLLTEQNTFFRARPDMAPRYMQLLEDSLDELPPAAWTDVFAPVWKRVRHGGEANGSLLLLDVLLLPSATAPRCDALLCCVKEPPLLSSLRETLVQHAEQCVQAQNWAAALHLYPAAAAVNRALSETEEAARCSWAAAVCALRLELPEKAGALSAESGRTQEPDGLPQALRGEAPRLLLEAALSRHAPQEAELPLAQLTAQAGNEPIALARAAVLRARVLLEPQPQSKTQPEPTETAAALLQEAAAVLPKEEAARAWADAGDALRSLNRFDEAARCYEAVLRLADKNTADGRMQRSDACTALGLCAFGRGDSAQELAQYEQALAQLPEEQTAQSTGARCRLHRYMADTCFRCGQTVQGNGHYAQALHAAAALKMDQLAAKVEDEWADHLNHFTEDLPGAALHYSNAIALYARQDHNDSDVCYALALAYNGRSICRYRSQAYHEAIHDTSKALELLRGLPHEPEVLVMQAFVLRNRADGYAQLAQYRLAGDDYLEAVTLYQEACNQDASLRLRPELPELLLCCGRTSDQLHLFDESGVYYSELLMLLEPRMDSLTQQEAEYAAVACFKRAYALIHGQNRAFSRALTDLTRTLGIVDAAPDPSYFAALRARTYRQRGELYAAMEQYALAAADFSAAQQAEQNSGASESSDEKGTSEHGADSV